MIDGDRIPVKGEITQGPFAHPLLREIFYRFGKMAFSRSCGTGEFDHFLKRIGAKGKRCLEIGTYHGITAVMLSQYFESVVCVSLDEEPEKLMKRDIAHFLGLKDRIEFIDVRTNAEKAMIIRELQFDFAFADGNHANDTYEDFELVQRCGRVLFHEAWPLQAPVWNLVNSLPADEVTRAQFECFAYWERKRG